MKFLAIFFLALSIGAEAQQTVTGTCTVQIPAGSGLPAGMTFDGTTLIVPVISATKLVLTGGTTYADGDYLTHIAGGIITYTKYTPGAATAVSFMSVVLPATAFAQATSTVTQQTFPIPAIGSRRLLYVIPPDGVTSQWLFDVTTTKIRVRNLSSQAGTLPAMTVTAVIQ